MKYTSSAPISILFLATTTLASPLSGIKSRSNPNQPAPAPKRPQPLIGNATATDYSYNWSGAVYTGEPDGAPFTSVTGTFTVPQPQPPTGGSGSWYGTAWVGIDGDTNGNAILQGGVNWGVTRDDSGALSYEYTPWVEWFPLAQSNIGGISVNSGDIISVTCSSTSSTTGFCTYINHSNGQQTTADASAPSSSNSLQGVNAEWIVEDFSSNGGDVPFANFGTVTFQSCSASDNAGHTVGPDGATPFDIVDSNGNVLAAGSTNGDSVTCQYQ